MTERLNWTAVRISSGQSLSHVWLCDPMNRSTPGLPVHHHLPEFTQTHVHPDGDAIQPSHPLSSRFPPAPNPSQHQRVFSNEATLCMMCPKYWSFSFSVIPSKEHPGLISFRMDWLDLLAVRIDYTKCNLRHKIILWTLERKNLNIRLKKKRNVFLSIKDLRIKVLEDFLRKYDP